jgi:hypothetical protein
MDEIKRARLSELEHKLKWLGHLPAYETEEIIQFVREAWTDKVRIIANADERWIKYQHDLKNLREELAEKTEALKQMADGPTSKYKAGVDAFEFSVFCNETACEILSKWDRTTKEFKEKK